MRELDLEREVVDRLQAKRLQRGVDRGLVALRVHQRDLLTVEHSVGEEGFVRRRQSRVDQALPGVDKVLRLDRGPVPILGGGPQVEDVGRPGAVHLVALRRGRLHTAQVCLGLEQRLGDGAQQRRLVGVLRLAGVQRWGLVLELHPQHLVLRELRPDRDAAITGGRDCCDRDHGANGAPEP